MAGDEVRVLWCLIQGQSTPFDAIAPVNANIHHVKKLVKEEGIDERDNIIAKDITLWKLNKPIPIIPEDGLAERIQLLGHISQFAVRLESAYTVLAVYPKHPCADHLHVIAQVPLAEGEFVARHVDHSPPTSPFHHPHRVADYPPRKRPRVLSPPHDPTPRFVLRTDTVSALYKKLNSYQFIQVRGTPASGKTSLAELVSQHIRQQEPTTRVIWIQGWSRDQVQVKGRCQHYFETEMGWVKHEKTVFVFDEAQMSYEDGDLWNNFFKSIHFYPNCRAIAFASYGSASSRFTIAGTPIIIEDAQRVTLRAIQHDDNLSPVGLFFTRMEFDDLVSNLYPSPEYRFDASFFNAVFDLTQGYAGAIHDFIKIILAHDSYRTIKNVTGQSYTWSSFLEEVSPRAFVKALETSASIFKRGLPLNGELQLPSVAHVFFSVLSTGVVTDAEITTADGKNALFLCFRNGWLHTDKLDSIGRPDESGYFFPSPLHRWYVEWKLHDTLPEKPFDCADILELITGVISKFSPRKLSTERRIGSGCIQRPPEAQYQDEFYRCCHTYSNGSLLTFPEFGTAKGRVDFYIPTKKWGVELLRDGDRLTQHSGRFSPTGSYATTLPLSDYIILDCRITNPTAAYPDLQKLHHIVFSDNFRRVRILDNRLELVRDGEFTLAV